MSSTATPRRRRDYRQNDIQNVCADHRSEENLPYRPTFWAHVEWDSRRLDLSDKPVIQRAITLVQGKWKIAILCHLQDGPVRVGELKRRMAPISKKVLNQHLRRMEKDGLLVRTDLSALVPHIEYALTNPLGYSVLGSGSV